MVSSATRRRFSREPVMNAVSSGASSVTRSMFLPAPEIRVTRCGGGGGGFAVFFLRGTGGSGNDDRHDLAGLIAAARRSNTVLAIDREVAGALDPRALRVADVVQPRDQLRLAEALAGLQRQRSREHARHGAVALTVQPRVDDASVRHVEIRRRAPSMTTTVTPRPIVIRRRYGASTAGQRRRARRIRQPRRFFFFKARF